nr:hypothetical protein CFP56_55416 [Quercus suber]
MVLIAFRYKENIKHASFCTNFYNHISLTLQGMQSFMRTRITPSAQPPSIPAVSYEKQAINAHKNISTKVSNNSF